MPITIEEAKKKKDKLEKDIGDLIHAFNKECDVSIKCLDCETHILEMSTPGKEILTGIRVIVEL